MKENPTLPRLQDSSYSNGHFTGKHNHIICGSVRVGEWVSEESYWSTSCVQVHKSVFECLEAKQKSWILKVFMQF
jgi:hypothetical protein